MTYEEALIEQRGWLKDSIKARLYKYDPIKYAKYKNIGKKSISASEISNIHNVIRIIHNHEHGDPFEVDDTFFKFLNRKWR